MFAVKLVTLTPELEGSLSLIKTLREQYAIAVSFGHSAAQYDTGLAYLKSVAKVLAVFSMP